MLIISVLTDTSNIRAASFFRQCFHSCALPFLRSAFSVTTANAVLNRGKIPVNFYASYIYTYNCIPPPTHPPTHPPTPLFPSLLLPYTPYSLLNTYFAQFSFLFSYHFFSIKFFYMPVLFLPFNFLFYYLVYKDKCIYYLRHKSASI